MALAVNFFELEIFDVRFGTSVTKDIKMRGVVITLPKKMVITNRPTMQYPMPIYMENGPDRIIRRRCLPPATLNA